MLLKLRVPVTFLLQTSLLIPLAFASTPIPALTPKPQPTPTPHRLPKGAKCPYRYGVICMPGLDCLLPEIDGIPVKTDNFWENYRCREAGQKPFGARCQQHSQFKKPDGVCVSVMPVWNETCRAPIENFQPCELTNIIYPRSIRFSLCKGFCAAGGPTKWGVCAPLQPLGGICVENSNCKYAICNKFGRDQGVCADSTTLLRKLGAPCDVRRDLCDAELQLRCIMSPRLGRTVCQQRHDDRPALPMDSSGLRYCTPGTDLSSCGSKHRLLQVECRTPRSDNRTKCLPKRMSNPAGTPCIEDWVQCSHGSTCKVITEVETGCRYRGETGPVAKYCVRLLQRGMNCSLERKFEEQCVNGLLCMNGTCAKPEKLPDYTEYFEDSCLFAPPFPNTHLTQYVDCDLGLPCIPGFSCQRNDIFDYVYGEDAKVCMPKKKRDKLLKRGERCDDIVDAQICEEGLVCRTRWNAYGAFRCRSPKRAGAYCEDDDWCLPGLMCNRRCFDPRNAVLELGAACDRRNKFTGPYCSIGKVRRGGEIIDKELDCLPLKNGTFVCQIPALPFKQCGFTKYMACSGFGFECVHGVCLPKQ